MTSLPKTVLILVLAAVMVFGHACSSMKPGVSSDKMTGNWEGTLTIPNGPQVKLILEFFTNADGEYRAFLTVPQQDDSSLFIQDITIDKKAVNFSIDTVGAEYTGTFADKNKIEGEFSQGGQKFPLVLERVQ